MTEIKERKVEATGRQVEVRQTAGGVGAYWFPDVRQR